MEYIDYFGWILNSDFLQKGDDELTMVEEAQGGEKEQRVRIVCSSSSVSKMSLYGFNALEKGTAELFPFFNQRTVGSGKAPHGLTSFCDYILLVQHVKGLFVFFLEMKRGRHDDADKQIEASSVFFDYIVQSAERVKAENGFQDFDPQQVRYRKIVINNASSNKRITKDKDLEGLDLNSVIIHKCQSEFRPVGYCK